MIDLAPLLHLGLLLVRPGTLILVAPAFGGTYAPAPLKVALTMFLAIGLLPMTTVPSVDAAVPVLLLVVREMAIGLALALAIRALVAGAEFGGHLVGFQMGLSYSAIVDPASGVRNDVLSTLYGTLATLVFFMSNAHHAFLRALGQSYQSLPIGAGHVSASLPEGVMALLGLVFTFGLRLAIPLIVVLLITELGLGLMARTAPALNLMVVGTSIRTIVGLLLLGFVAPAAVGLLANAQSSLLPIGLRIAEAFR